MFVKSLELPGGQIPGECWKQAGGTPPSEVARGGGGSEAWSQGKKGRRWHWRLALKSVI